MEHREKIKAFIEDSFKVIGLELIALQTLSVRQEHTLKNMLLFLMREAASRQLGYLYDKAEEIVYLYF